MLVPRIGYCEPNCVLCSQVCPTGAIWEITVAEKIGTRGSGPGGRGSETRRRRTPSHNDPTAEATTRFASARRSTIAGRCLPWAMAIECIVCEEWCPTSPKAIYLVPAEVVDSDGRTKTVKQPFVDPKRCTGCGACEYACPIKGSPAIYVTSAGETPLADEPVPAEREPAPAEVIMKKRQRYQPMPTSTDVTRREFVKLGAATAAAGGIVLGVPAFAGAQDRTPPAAPETNINDFMKVPEGQARAARRVPGPRRRGEGPALPRRREVRREGRRPRCSSAASAR